MDIKKLSSYDCDTFRQELTQYIYESNNHCEYINNYSLDEADTKVSEMKEYIQNEKAIVYGAVENEKLMGFVWGYTYPFREDTNRLYVSIIHVSNACRSRGIGKQLLSALETEAKKIGYSAIFLHTEAFNTGAIHFYEREGFLKERIQLAKIIDRE